MQWLAENWLLVLLGGGMVAMHLFGHGHGHGHGHGGHGGGKGGGGGHGGCGAKKSADDSAAEPTAVSTDESAGSARPEEHRHG